MGPTRPWMTFDFDLATSRARFTDDDPARDHIPGALETVLSGGIAMHSRSTVFGSLRAALELVF